MKPRRLGRAPIGQIDSIAREGREHGPYDPQNVADSILADKLADYDDPREIYVRRDIGYRDERGNNGYAHNMEMHHRELAGEGNANRHYGYSTAHDLPDGTTITISPHGGTLGNPTSYEHFWQTKETPYGAILSPQEHREQMQKLGLTQELPTQMSRGKPLVISYRRNVAKKYGVSTVARVMGHGQYGNEMPPMMVGSRLASVLREIKHGVGQSNPQLAKLAEHGLSGSHRPDVYTGIRDELFKTKDPRAVQLARQYNWHKVGEGLERDKNLRDFVANSAKGTRHENDNRMYRRFYNGVVHGKEGPDEGTRQLFYKAMRKHLQNTTGKDHSYEDIENSLRRLGETEENVENVKRTGGKGQSKFALPDFPHPAYTGVPKEGKFPPKKQITPPEKRSPGQYRRFSYRLYTGE